MKKLFYIVLVVVALFVVIQVVKNKQAEQTPAVDVMDVVSTGENEAGNTVVQEDVIAIDEDNGEAVEEDAVEVIEDNPDATANDDETIVGE